MADKNSQESHEEEDRNQGISNKLGVPGALCIRLNCTFLAAASQGSRKVLSSYEKQYEREAVTSIQLVQRQCHILHF